MILDGRPLKGKELDQLKDFLGSREVEYDPKAEYTVCLLNDSYEIEAAGSVCGHVICCVAFGEAGREKYAHTLIARLVQYQFKKTRSHILVYTRPEYLELFREQGFYPVLNIGKTLLMENRICGLRSEIIEEGMDDMLEEEQKCSILCNLLIENKKIQELIPADIRNKLLHTSQKNMYETRFKE